MPIFSSSDPGHRAYFVEDASIEEVKKFGEIPRRDFKGMRMLNLEFQTSSRVEHRLAPWIGHNLRSRHRNESPDVVNWTFFGDSAAEAARKLRKQLDRHPKAKESNLAVEMSFKQGILRQAWIEFFNRFKISTRLTPKSDAINGNGRSPLLSFPDKPPTGIYDETIEDLGLGFLNEPIADSQLCIVLQFMLLRKSIRSE